MGNDADSAANLERETLALLGHDTEWAWSLQEMQRDAVLWLQTLRREGEEEASMLGLELSTKSNDHSANMETLCYEYCREHAHVVWLPWANRYCLQPVPPPMV